MARRKEVGIEEGWRGQRGRMRMLQRKHLVELASKGSLIGR
jgi:hypothetical protein